MQKIFKEPRPIFSLEARPRMLGRKKEHEKCRVEIETVAHPGASVRNELCSRPKGPGSGSLKPPTRIASPGSSFLAWPLSFPPEKEVAAQKSVEDPTADGGWGAWQVGFFSVQEGGRPLAENRLCSIIYRKRQEKTRHWGCLKSSFPSQPPPSLDALSTTQTRGTGELGFPHHRRCRPPREASGVWHRDVSGASCEGKAGHMVGWSTLVRPLGHADPQESQRLGM